MAHYALLSDNLVVDVFVGRDENDVVQGIDDWETYYAPEGFTVKQTSYNTYGGIHHTTDDGGNRIPSDDQSKALRFNYAGIGYTFDPDKGTDGAFIPPKPFESWVLDEDTCLWVAPLPYPEDGATYTWNEELFAWELVTDE
jgi:hypothetical protein